MFNLWGERTVCKNGITRPQNETEWDEQYCSLMRKALTFLKMMRGSITGPEGAREHWSMVIFENEEHKQPLGKGKAMTSFVVQKEQDKLCG